MKTIFTEEEVNLDVLQDHFLNSGFQVENRKEFSFGIRSRNGLYISFRIDKKRNYIGFNCYFDLDQQRSELDKLLLVQRYNYNFFLASFSLGNDENELIASYFMSYELGLIAGQMMHVFRRFSSLLDSLIEKENEDKLIVLGHDEVEQEIANDDVKIIPNQNPEGYTQ